MSQIWDLDPGFMDDALLTEQMRLVSGLLNGKQVQHAVVPDAWQGHDTALVLRLNLLMAEMHLRKMPTPEYQPLPEGAVIWPVRAMTSPLDELKAMKDRTMAGRTGRIAIPKNEHELWARYKYSVMARNHHAYTALGKAVASRKISHQELLLELVNACHVVPPRSSLHNAVQHMWGYVSAYASHAPDYNNSATLLALTQSLALEHDVAYLLNSTALGELAVWCVLL